MSTQYGFKLNPTRKLRKPAGVKGIRQTITNTHDASTIKPGGVLNVLFPDIGRDDVVVPGTTKLTFKIELNSTDANATIVNNLGRSIISKIAVKLESKEVFTLNDSNVFYCYQDLWKTTDERSNAAYQGIQSEAGLKHRINAGDKGTVAKDIALGTMFSNQFSIPLDFEILESHMPFYQSELKDRLSYHLTFNDYKNVIVSSDDASTYTISDINLEFDVITSSELAMSLQNLQKGKFTVLYDNVVLGKEIGLNKSDRLLNISIAPLAKSMKGVLVLFVDPKLDFAKDSETFYNPKITNVLTTLAGKPNQLYSSGMKPQNHFSEIRKYFADGRYRTNANVFKEAELADVKLEDYATNKYALWLDMRSTDDDSLHGTGRKIEGSNQSIHIQIDKKVETAGDLTAYVYYIQDAQLNFNNGRLDSIVY